MPCIQNKHPSKKIIIIKVHRYLMIIDYTFVANMWQVEVTFRHSRAQKKINKENIHVTMKQKLLAIFNE